MEKRKREVMFQNIDMSSYSIYTDPPYRKRLTPLVVTLSDPRITAVDMQTLMENGMDVVKFRLSNVFEGDAVKMFRKLDRARTQSCQKYGVFYWPIASWVVLKTCVIKTGMVQGRDVEIKLDEGDYVVLTTRKSEFDKCNKHQIYVDNTDLNKDIVIVGMKITIGSEDVVLECTEIIDDYSIRCVVILEGKVYSMQKVFIKGAKLHRQVLTAKDTVILNYAMEHEVDIIQIQYVETIDIINKVKEFIGKEAMKTMIILSAICSVNGLNNIDEIIKESDGIILSRDYLAYELNDSMKFRMPLIQKWLGALCQKANKPYYICGGVFRTALTKGEICEHEVFDVANAILDGATSFILKEYSSIDFTLNTIQYINHLCRCHEPLTNDKNLFWRLVEEKKMPNNAAYAAILAALTAMKLTNSKVLVLTTMTGRTAKALLWLKPDCLIIAITTSHKVMKYLQGYRSIVALAYTGTPLKNWLHTIESRISFAIEYAVKRGWVEYGDIYVTLRGSNMNSYCDAVSIWKVEIAKKTLVECDETPEDYMT